ncbi:Uncharacterised protein [Actinomyces bovis]|uniref:Uncharacterized protein n=1 Tax=Actinomyces bovis TaxID=1658 RepID=A0ABY1VKL3_9ACTO|nr:Uncharacterised protein [Actinomyces bovis]VEG54503.1 Uncharacterised protein [Actinomyces israelii]
MASAGLPLTINRHIPRLDSHTRLRAILHQSCQFEELPQFDRPTDLNDWQGRLTLLLGAHLHIMAGAQAGALST